MSTARAFTAALVVVAAALPIGIADFTCAGTGCTECLYPVGGTCTSGWTQANCAAAGWGIWCPASAPVAAPTPMPSVGNPVATPTFQPTTKKPATKKPTTKKPTTKRPTTIKPAAGSPTFAPTTAQPAATPTPPPPTPPSSSCGTCTNCYYAPTLSCFVGWTQAQCASVPSYTWCGTGTAPTPTPPAPTPPAPTPPAPTPPAPPTAPGTGIGKYISATQFASMFPLITSGSSLYQPICTGAGFFTYQSFIDAANAYPTFGTSKDDATNKLEIAAFLAQASQETNGANVGQYNGGLCFKDEGGVTPTTASYCVADPANPCAPGQSYRGRGPLQLSYNFNYGPCGRALGLDLLNNPNYLSTDATASFKASLWFWMTPQSPKPSCHDAMVGNVSPSGFGQTTNIINGGVLGCGDGNPTRSAAEQQKMGYYHTYESFLGLPVTSNTADSCANIPHY